MSVWLTVATLQQQMHSKMLVTECVCVCRLLRNLLVVYFDSSGQRLVRFESIAAALRLV
jgi:hypothetical protein